MTNSTLLAEAEYELRQAARILHSLIRIRGDDDGALARCAAKQVAVADRLRAAMATKPVASRTPLEVAMTNYNPPKEAGRG
jgi:hypothetical protein